VRAVPRQASGEARRFAIALFAGIDRPRVQPRLLGLDELVQLLTRFEILSDKRGGPLLVADAIRRRREDAGQRRRRPA